MKRQPRPGGRTEAEIRKLVKGYEKSGQTRAVYCAGQGLRVSTLDYYRWRLRRNQPALVEVDLGDTGIGLGSHGAPGDEPVAVVLRNGRRVEIGWNDLGRVGGQSQPFRALIECLEGA
jgi:hypothetical protein